MQQPLSSKSLVLHTNEVSARPFAPLAVLLLILCVSSCQQRQNAEVHIVKELECKQVEAAQLADSIVSNVALGLWDWRITKGYVVVRTSESKGFVHVLSYPSFTERYRACELGRGAGEYITHNWCATHTDGMVAIYDIMNATLHTYTLGDTVLLKAKDYELNKDGDGLCLPFTKMYECRDGRFLMKEDGISTTLWCMDLGNGKQLDKYVQEVRSEKYADHSYSPFDYDIAVAGDKVLLTYLCAPRMELLRIEEDGHLTPEVFTGTSDFDEIVKQSDPPYVFLATCSDGRTFYCLHSNNGGDYGHEVYVVNDEGVITSILDLQHDVNSIQCTPDGYLVAYKEQGDSSVFYRFHIED